MFPADKELSDWFRSEWSNFPRLTAEMDRLRTDLTKSCLGKILEERTVLYEVQEETLLLLSYL